MDKKGSAATTTGRWDWLRDHMPQVTALMREKRKAWGDAHVNECWRRGVLEGQAGWFYAREGPLALGVPFDDPVLAQLAMAPQIPTQAALVLRTPEQCHE